MAKRKPKIIGWILEAELSDGRVVTLDVDSDTAGTVDDFLTAIESNKEIEDWIVNARKPLKTKYKEGIKEAKNEKKG